MSGCSSHCRITKKQTDQICRTWSCFGISYMWLVSVEFRFFTMGQATWNPLYMVFWVHYTYVLQFIYRSCQLMTQMLSFCHLWSSSSLASWRRCVCLVVTAGWLRVSTNSAHFEVWKPYCCYEWKYTNVYIQTLQDYHGNCLACWVHCWDTFSFRPSSIATTSHP